LRAPPAGDGTGASAGGVGGGVSAPLAGVPVGDGGLVNTGVTRWPERAGCRWAGATSTAGSVDTGMGMGMGAAAGGTGCS
jgi:hypothetical protein